MTNRHLTRVVEGNLPSHERLPGRAAAGSSPTRGPEASSRVVTRWLVRSSVPVLALGCFGDWAPRSDATYVAETATAPARSYPVVYAAALRAFINDLMDEEWLPKKRPGAGNDSATSPCLQHVIPRSRITRTRAPP
jgi:hypothetical protein